MIFFGRERREFPRGWEMCIRDSVQCAPFDVTLLRADGASFYERISTDFFGE